MYYVSKRMEVAGAHRLDLPYESKCSNLHGHNWIITVYCKAEKLTDYGMVIDPENVRYCHLDGRDTKLKTNIQENDRDGIKDEYLTECSLEVRLPKTHMLLTGCY